MGVNKQKIFDRFVSLWTHESYPPKLESEKSLEIAEHKLGIFFPITYKQFLTGYGSFGTVRNLLDSIVETDLDIRDLSELYSSMDVVEITEQRRKARSLPADLVAVGSDCSGNNYCYRVKDCSNKNIDDAEIWVYDYSFASLDKEADSFIDWINKLSLIVPIV